MARRARDLRPDVGPFENAAPASREMRLVLGLGLAAVGVLLAYLLYALWPAVVDATQPSPSQSKILLFGGRIDLAPTPDSVLVLLVLLAGSIGAYIHVATSFAEFVGVRSFARSWFWWYMLRLPIGAVLAVIFYFALRGGLLAADGDSNAVNPYGVGALAALAGLFSKQATDKLSEVFDTAFQTREGYGDDRRSDTRVHPPPTLKRLSPGGVPAAQDSELVLTGTGFVDASEVRIKASDPANLTPVLLRSDKARLAENEMMIRLAAGELASGDYAVSVITEAPGGGVSEAKRLQVT